MAPIPMMHIVSPVKVAYMLHPRSYLGSKLYETSPIIHKLFLSAARSMAAEHNKADATEHCNDAQLAELINQEAGQTGEYELKVIRASIQDYQYTHMQESN